MAVLAITLHNFPTPHRLFDVEYFRTAAAKITFAWSQKKWAIGFDDNSANHSIGFWYYKTNFPQKYKCSLIRTRKNMETKSDNFKPGLDTNYISKTVAHIIGMFCNRYHPLSYGRGCRRLWRWLRELAKRIIVTGCAGISELVSFS